MFDFKNWPPQKGFEPVPFDKFSELETVALPGGENSKSRLWKKLIIGVSVFVSTYSAMNLEYVKGSAGSGDGSTRLELSSAQAGENGKIEKAAEKMVISGFLDRFEKQREKFVKGKLGDEGFFQEVKAYLEDLDSQGNLGSITMSEVLAMLEERGGAYAGYGDWLKNNQKRAETVEKKQNEENFYMEKVALSCLVKVKDFLNKIGITKKEQIKNMEGTVGQIRPFVEKALKDLAQLEGRSNYNPENIQNLKKSLEGKLDRNTPEGAALEATLGEL